MPVDPEARRRSQRLANHTRAPNYVEATEEEFSAMVFDLTMDNPYVPVSIISGEETLAPEDADRVPAYEEFVRPPPPPPARAYPSPPGWLFRSPPQVPEYTLASLGLSAQDWGLLDRRRLELLIEGVIEQLDREQAGNTDAAAALDASVTWALNRIG